MLKRLDSTLLNYGAVIAAYTLITCIVTYPVALTMTTAMAGCAGDVEQYVWALWWAKRALIDLHTSPANISSLFYPTGVYVPIQFTWPYVQLLAVPTLSMFGPVAAYNIEMLLSFILAGFTAYLLCYHLTGSKLAAFVGGCIYSFSSFHFIHAVAGHLNLVQIQWFPLYALFMLRLVKTPRLKTAILTGVFWALSLSVFTAYIGYFGILFPLAFLAYHIWANRKAVLNARFLRYFFLSSAIAGILIAPFLLPFVSEVLSGKGIYVTAYGTLHYSPDLFSFLVPHPYHPVFAKVGLIRSIATQITKTDQYESTIYVGWLALALAFIGARKNPRASGFWVFLGLGAAILSLGPFLIVGGHPAKYSIESIQSLIVMPYALFRKLPFFAMDRTSGRLAVLLMLAISVLAGYGLTNLLKATPNSKTRIAIVLGFTSFIVAESIVMFPFPVLDASVPRFYLDLSHDSEDYAILDIPATLASGRTMYYQIYHQHRIVGGYLQRAPAEVYDIARSLSALAMPGDIVQKSPDKPGLLSKHGVRYVVIQKNLLSDADSTSLVSYLERALGNPVYEDEKICAFLVPKLEQDMIEASVPNVSLAEGWHDLELWNGVPTRWMGNQARVYLDHEQTSGAVLSFRLQAFLKPRNLEIYVNDKVIGEFQASSQEWQRYTTSTFPLRAGRNVIKFRSKVPCDSPLALNLGLDGRCLSLAVQEIQLSSVSSDGQE